MSEPQTNTSRTENIDEITRDSIIGMNFRTVGSGYSIRMRAADKIRQEKTHKQNLSVFLY